MTKKWIYFKITVGRISIGIISWNYEKSNKLFIRHFLIFLFLEGLENRHFWDHSTSLLHKINIREKNFFWYVPFAHKTRMGFSFLRAVKLGNSNKKLFQLFSDKNCDVYKIFECFWIHSNIIQSKLSVWIHSFKTTPTNNSVGSIKKITHIQK